MALEIKEYIDNQPIHVDEETRKKVIEDEKSKKRRPQKIKKQPEKNTKGAKN